MAPWHATATTQGPSNDNYLYSVDLNLPGEPLGSALYDTKYTFGASTQQNLFSPCDKATCPIGPAEQTSCDGATYGKTVWYDFYPDHSGQVEIRALGIPTVISLYSYDLHTLVPTRLRCAPGSSNKTNELFAYVQKGVAYTYQIGRRGQYDGPIEMVFNYAYRDLAVAPFQAAAVLTNGSTRLHELRVIGLVRGEAITAACALCGGGLAFPGVAQGTEISLSATRAIADAKTRIIIEATAPAQIGRYKVYAIDPWRVVASGCLSPTSPPVSAFDALHPVALGVTCPSLPISPAGAEYVFWSGPGRWLWDSWYTGVRWSDPLRLGARPMGSTIAVAVHADGQQDVFWRGRGGDLWETWYMNGWHRPHLLSHAQMTYGPTVGVDAADNEYVFWRGPDGRLHTESYSAGNWTSPVLINNSGILASAPAVAVHPDGRQDVFWRGTDDDLWEMSYTSRWNAPHRVGATNVASRPTVAIDGAGNDYVFWEGFDGGLWRMTQIGGQWTAPTAISSGVLGSPPTVAVHANGEQDVFWRGTDGKLWETWFASGWHTPRAIGSAQLSSAPSAGVATSGKQGAS
jgi:hypothetical protein